LRKTEESQRALQEEYLKGPLGLRETKGGMQKKPQSLLTKKGKEDCCVNERLAVLFVLVAGLNCLRGNLIAHSSSSRETSLELLIAQKEKGGRLIGGVSLSC